MKNRVITPHGVVGLTWVEQAPTIGQVLKTTSYIFLNRLSQYPYATGLKNNYNKSSSSEPA